MIEITLVVVAIMAVGLIGFLASVLSSHLVTAVGFSVLLLGLAVGVPTGFWYHVVLYRFVSTRIALPRGWWLSPANLHRYLTDAEQRRLNPWYRMGGVGFVLSVAGGVVAIVGVLTERW